MVNYDPKIHSVSQLVKSIFGRIEKSFGGLKYGADELIVVNYHSTPKKFTENFKEQLAFYKTHFNIISPSDLALYYSGELRSGKVNLLLTFDDGLKNNLNAAALLNEHGINALFFLVPDFLNCEKHLQKDYYLKNIRPVINPNIDSADEDFMAMDEIDIRSLLNSGHMIGCHTMSHTLIAAHSDQQNSEKEIVQSKNILEKKFGLTINSFCSINNTLESVAHKEKELVRVNYSFHFTTIPGLNSQHKDSLFIKRRNVECFWMKGALYYALGRWDLKRWGAARKIYIRL